MVYGIQRRFFLNFLTFSSLRDRNFDQRNMDSNPTSKKVCTRPFPHPLALMSPSSSNQRESSHLYISHPARAESHLVLFLPQTDTYMQVSNSLVHQPNYPVTQYVTFIGSSRSIVALTLFAELD